MPRCGTLPPGTAGPRLAPSVPRHAGGGARDLNHHGDRCNLRCMAQHPAPWRLRFRGRSGRGRWVRRVRRQPRVLRRCDARAGVDDGGWCAPLSVRHFRGAVGFPTFSFFREVVVGACRENRWRRLRRSHCSIGCCSARNNFHRNHYRPLDQSSPGKITNPPCDIMFDHVCLVYSRSVGTLEPPAPRGPFRTKYILAPMGSASS